MSAYGIIFYILSALILIATGFAITSRYLMHAVVYAAISFVGSALLFYLLGAPFLAALEVIIYAGAVMVLFLFVVMTFPYREPDKSRGSYARQWIPASALSAVSLGIAIAALFFEPGAAVPLMPGQASPAGFGRFLYDRYWLGVEIASFLLFAALAGGLYLGRAGERK